MRSLPRLAMLGALALSVSPVHAAEKSSQSAALIGQGRAIAQEQCRRCHAIDLTGESPVAQAPLFRRLAERYPLDHLAEAFAEGIVVSHTEMPQFQLEPLEIEALIAYLASLERRGGRRR